MKVYAIDANPDAVMSLMKNVRLNRVYGKVYSILGDARDVVRERLSGVADRVIMNLPETAVEFVDVACLALKPTGGVVHFYTFVRAPGLVEDVEVLFKKTARKCGRTVRRVLLLKRVRATAPREWQVVLDTRVG